MQSLESRIRKAEERAGPDEDGKMLDFRAPGGRIIQTTQGAVRRMVEGIWTMSKTGAPPEGAQHG